MRPSRVLGSFRLAARSQSVLCRWTHGGEHPDPLCSAHRFCCHGFVYFDDRDFDHLPGSIHCRSEGRAQRKDRVRPGILGAQRIGAQPPYNGRCNAVIFHHICQQRIVENINPPDAGQDLIHQRLNKRVYPHKDKTGVD
jgi:hypothetical protein